jgi:hypothetical protein
MRLKSACVGVSHYIVQVFLVASPGALKVILGELPLVAISEERVIEVKELRRVVHQRRRRASNGWLWHGCCEVIIHGLNLTSVR